MLLKSLNYHADYSIRGLKYVELLLMQIKPDLEEDADLLVDSALYIGETVRRVFNTAWDISDDKNNFPEGYGQPFTTGNDNHKPFYPFVEIKNFLSDPVAGYFQKLIQSV